MRRGRRRATPRRRIWSAALGALLAAAACGPSDDEYRSAAREAVARGCCSVQDRVDRCSTCPLLANVTITSEKSAADCANTCRRVELETRSAQGSAVCTYLVSRTNGAWRLQGACRPK